MNVRNLRRHLYIVPIVVAAMVAVLTAYAGSPHDGDEYTSAATVAGMSVPF